MKSGILLIDKPAGLTSAGVVARVKRILGAKRVGHAGTLDPDATGLLVILINGATRVASYASDGWKVYSGEMRLGLSTSTDDLSGEVLLQGGNIPEFDLVKAATRGFTGEINQVPPRVSAIKVNGKRAHKLHRTGVEFELAPRRVEVRRFDITNGSEEGNIQYVVECSPGTYIRSLARDLGQSLGCGGTVSTIRRERSGHFGVESAVSLEQVAWSYVQDWSVLLPTVPRLEVSEAISSALLNGQQIGLARAWERWQMKGQSAAEDLVVFHTEGVPDSLGILRVKRGDGFEFETNIHTESYCHK